MQGDFYCEKCKVVSNMKLHKQSKAGGGYHLSYICPNCNDYKRPQTWVGKSVLPRSVNIEDLPTWLPKNATVGIRLCSVLNCDLSGELHHVKPRGVDGLAYAERWPKVYLCQIHHAELHSVAYEKRWKERKPITLPKKA